MRSWTFTLAYQKRNIKSKLRDIQFERRIDNRSPGWIIRRCGLYYIYYRVSSIFLWRIFLILFNFIGNFFIIPKFYDQIFLLLEVHQVCLFAFSLVARYERIFAALFVCAFFVLSLLTIVYYKFKDISYFIILKLWGWDFLFWFICSIIFGDPISKLNT